MRVLRGLVYRMNSKGPRTELEVHHKENHVGKTDYQSSGHGKREITSMILNSLRQCRECQTRMIDERVECCDLWCQRQQTGQEDRDMILVVNQWH